MSFAVEGRIQRCHTYSSIWGHHKPKPTLEEKIDAINALWNFLWQLPQAAVQIVWKASKHSLGATIRDSFFFLLDKMDTLMPGQNAHEKKFYDSIWDQSATPDSINFPLTQKIRNHFCYEDIDIDVAPSQIDSSTPLSMRCRMISSHDTSANCWTCLVLPGNLSTIDNNAVGGLYSYLSAYVKAKQQNRSLLPARFICLSQNNISKDGAPYKPATLTEVGQIYAQAIHKLKETYGQSNQIVSHSVGTINLAAAFKNGNISDFPDHIHFDRGPTSIEALSKKMQFGRLLLAAARFSGWDLDVAGEIKEFCKQKQSNGHTPSLVVSGVKHDFYFKDDANLSQDLELNKMKEITCLTYNPPFQVFGHERAHHAVAPHLLHRNYLMANPDNKLGPDESLADYAIKHSLAARIQALG